MTNLVIRVYSSFPKSVPCRCAVLPVSPKKNLQEPPKSAIISKYKRKTSEILIELGYYLNSKVIVEFLK